MRIRFLVEALAGTALLAGLALPGYGQTDRGTITGLVTDSAGAALANATLELRGVETGITYPTATSNTGNYTFTQIPVGTYQLTVSAPGFKNYVRQNIPVQGAQTLGLDIEMEIGTASESVTVTAEVSLLRTESSDISTNVEAQRMTTLPILPIGNGFSSSHGVRNPMAVANLSPGTYFDPNLNIKVNGAPSNTAAIHVDGQDATNGVVTFSQAQTQPSVEGLEELSIQSSNYAAEFGQAGAGLFNYTTRSGSNQWHGTLYNYLSNEALNAGQPYTHTRPQQRRNNFGGNLGGPVIIPKLYNGRDKTFFFFNYEAFKETGMINNQFPTVPTDAFRSGDFSAALAAGRPITGSPVDSTGRPARDGQIYDPATEFRDPQGRRVWLPFPNNVIPSDRIDPAAQRILALVPRPNLPGLVQNYNNPFPTDRFTSIPGVKIDHSISAKSKFAGYWSRTGTGVQYCVPLCGSDGLPDPITTTRGTFIESHTIRLNYDYIWSPALLLHVGAGFLRNDFKDTAPTTDFDLQGQLGISGATLSGAQGGRFPLVTGMLGGNSLGGLNNLGPTAGQVRAIENKPTFNASATYVTGNHTYKFGGESRFEGLIDYTYTNTTGNFNFNAQQTANPYFADAGINITGGTTGHPFASFLLGRVNTAQIAPFTQFRGGRNYWGAFAQDTWKVTRRLTLDYGLRWDYSTYSREQYGRAPAFDPTVPNANAGGHPGGAKFEGDLPGRCQCDFANNYPFAFGPRAGLAYQLTEKTVFRAGFGVSYSAYTGGRYAGAPGATKQIDAPGVGDPAMILGQGITNQGTPFTPVWPDIRPNLFPLPGTVSTPPGFGVFDQNRGRPARQTQWSVGLQRELFPTVVVEAAYVATRGVWWASSALTEYNALTPALLESYGLNIASAADRALLSTQIGSAAAGRFQNRLPYAGFPRTASVAQSLRPFPQFGNLTGAGPLGSTWYDSLQAKVTKRFSHGLDLSYNFTWAKELQLGADTDGGAPGAQINDVFNRNANKTWSAFSRPFWNVVAFNYTLPKWGEHRLVNAVVSDWTIGGVLQYGSGLPIPVPSTAQAASNLGTSLLRPTRAERIPGVPLFLQDLNCDCFDPAQTQVLNPAAWRDPVPGTFSPSAYYYNDYRYQRRPRETLSVGRYFRFGEKVRLQIRAEFNNAFNRVQVPNPVAAGYTTGIGRSGSVNNTGFGVIATRPNNAVTGERSGLLVGRLTF